MDILPKQSVAGVFTPDQYAIVQSVYKEIAAQVWFSQSPEKLQQFAVSIIKAYRGGIVSQNDLRDYCLTVAKRQFMNFDALMSEQVDVSSTVEKSSNSPDHLAGKHP